MSKKEDADAAAAAASVASFSLPLDVVGTRATLLVIGWYKSYAEMHGELMPGTATVYVPRREREDEYTVYRHHLGSGACSFEQFRWIVGTAVELAHIRRAHICLPHGPCAR